MVLQISPAKTFEKGLDIHANMEYYHFDVNVKVVQAL